MWRSLILAICICAASATDIEVVVWSDAAAAPLPTAAAANAAATPWVHTESVSTRTAGLAVGLRLDSAQLGGFRARVADAHAPTALPHAVERMTLLIDSPHAPSMRTCALQPACVAAMGGEASLTTALESPSVWLRVKFDPATSTRDRRLSEFALCEFLGAVIEPSTGFDAGACFLPATSASAASASASTSATAAPSLWDRHNLTSPSLVYPDSKLAPVPVELLTYLWPYDDDELATVGNIDPMQLPSNLASAHDTKYFRISLPTSSVSFSSASASSTEPSAVPSSGFASLLASSDRGSGVSERDRFGSWRNHMGAARRRGHGALDAAVAAKTKKARAASSSSAKPSDSLSVSAATVRTRVSIQRHSLAIGGASASQLEDIVVFASPSSAAASAASASVSGSSASDAASLDVFVDASAALSASTSATAAAATAANGVIHSFALTAAISARAPAQFVGTGVVARSSSDSSASAAALQPQQSPEISAMCLRPGSSAPASTACAGASSASASQLPPSESSRFVPHSVCAGRMRRELSKTGFHRNLLTSVVFDSVPSSSSSSSASFSPSTPSTCELTAGASSSAARMCWLWALETLPDSLYVDPFEVRELARFGGAESLVHGAVDIEKPQSLAAHDTVSTVLRGAHAFVPQPLSSAAAPGGPAGSSSSSSSVTFDLQVHLRYHSPSARPFVNVTIPPPLLFVKCAPSAAEVTALAWRRLILTSAAAAPSSSSAAVPVAAATAADSRIYAAVPVGVLSHDAPVMAATFACTCAAVLLLLHRIALVPASASAQAASKFKSG